MHTLKIAKGRRQATTLSFSMLIALLVSNLASSSSEVVLNRVLREHLVSLAPVVGAQVTDDVVRDRAVVVTFFASWCPPCREEFDYLNTLRTEYTNAQLSIIAVNVFEEFFEGGVPRLKRFLDETSPQFHVLQGVEKTRALFGNVERIPTLFVFTPTGEAVEHFVHKRGAKKQTANLGELRDAIVRALPK